MPDGEIKTYEETQEEENRRQHEEGHVEDGRLADEVDTGRAQDIGELIEEEIEGFGTILEIPTDDIQLDRAPREQLRQRRNTIISNSRDVRSNIQTTVEESLEVDLQGASNAQLLLIIAQTNQAIGQLLTLISNTAIDILETLFDISDFLAPFSEITVSGVNAIEDADTPEPVVPQADEKQIPTRFLLIKADEDNAVPITFGDDDIDPDNGFVLERGQFIGINLDLRNTVLYMAAAQEDQEVKLLGLL